MTRKLRRPRRGVPPRVQTALDELKKHLGVDPVLEQTEDLRYEVSATNGRVLVWMVFDFSDFSTRYLIYYITGLRIDGKRVRTVRNFAELKRVWADPDDELEALNASDEPYIGRSEMRPLPGVADAVAFHRTFGR